MKTRQPFGPKNEREIRQALELVGADPDPIHDDSAVD
jgi:hypothetical protein